MTNTNFTQSYTDLPPRTWHAEIAGARNGPLSAEQVRKLIVEGKLNRNSLTWYTGAADWQPLSTTEFASMFSDTPPPLSASAVPNGLVWTLAFAPLIGAFLGGLFAGMAHMRADSFWWVTLALNIVLSLADEKKLKAAGHDTAKMGSAWIVPVYLYKRAQVLNQSMGYFFAWVICFVISLVFG